MVLWALIVTGASSALAQFDRGWKIYVVPFSHTDIGYTAPVATVIQQHNVYLDSVVAYVGRTAGNAQGERFKWTIEIPWVLESYTQSRSAAQVESLMTLVRQGSVEIGALHFGLQTDMCGSEELVRSLYYAQELRDCFQVQIRTALLDDTPGFTWSMAQLLNKGGVPYFSVAMNSSLSDFYKTTTLPYLFNLQGQDGTKTLLWRCMDTQWAYLEGVTTYSVYGTYAVMEQKITNLLQQLQSQGYPYDAVYINCATGDNGPPRLEIVQNVQQWNAKYAGAKMIVATASEFFDYIVGAYSGVIPTFSGDGPNWWTWLFGPSATLGYSLSRDAQAALPSAETYATMASLSSTDFAYPERGFRDAYINNLYFEDHNLGAIDPAGNAPFWALKMGWVSAALDSASSIAGRSLDALAANIRSGSTPALAVFNPLAWKRSEIVRTDLSDPRIEAIGVFDVVDAATGSNVPVQKLADGSFAFWAENIPAAGYKTFRLVSRPGTFPPPGQITGLTLENDFYRITLNGSSGSVASLVDKSTSLDLTAKDGQFNLYRYNSTILPGPMSVIGTDSGEVLQSATLRGPATGSNWYETTVCIPARSKQVNFSNTYDKLAPSSLESIDFVFRSGLSAPTACYEIPFGSVRLFEDELSGFRVKHYLTGRWLSIAAGDGSFSMTLSSDHGPVFAASSPTFDGLVRQLVSFNDASSAYRAGIGILTMNYALTSAAGDLRRDAAARFGHSIAQPVQTRYVPAHQAGGLPDTSWSLATISPESLVLSTVKKPISGSGIILRIFNPLPSGMTATLLFAGDVLSAWETSILEVDGPILPSQGKELSLLMAPYEVKTLRVVLGSVTAVGMAGETPAGFVLFQNFPNPFNPATVIRYSLPSGGNVTLRITNLLGQLVRTLTVARFGPGEGEFAWNGRDDGGRAVASGVYFCTLEVSTGDHILFRNTKSMILLR